MRGTVGFPTSSGDQVEEGGLEGITDTGGARPCPSVFPRPVMPVSYKYVRQCAGALSWPEPRVRHGLCNLVGSH